jgi:hypothetical protein
MTGSQSHDLAAMTPYYQDDSVTIYHGDAREFVEVGGNVLLTDPPYGISGGRGGQAREHGKGKYLATAWDDTPEYIGAVVVPIIVSLLGSVARGAVTPGVANLALYPKPADMGAFFTPAAQGVGPWGFQTIHPILYYGRDYRAGRGALPTGRALTEAAEPNGHPCPKPVSAWTWLFSKVSEPGDVVVDPFMGSGTTLVAAKALSRKAIGIEIEERYCEIAARRCSQEVLGLSA